MVEYKKLTRFEIHKKYNNMIQRCYDEEWLQKEKFRNGMLDKAKQRLNKDYKV